MQGQIALTDRRATADDVLAYLNADYRLRAGLDPEVSDGEILARETTIGEWRAICDLIAARRLTRVLNAWFGLTESDTACLAVLVPEAQRTLGGLADFVAARARWQDFQSISVAGRPDAAAGAFFCLRGLLAQAGVPVAELRPSTPISSISRTHLGPLAEALSRLAPSLVPVPEVTLHRRQQVGAGLVVLSVLALLVAGLMSQRALAVASAVGVALGLLLRRGPVADVGFGPHRTFGELARAMAALRRATP